MERPRAAPINSYASLTPQPLRLDEPKSDLHLEPPTVPAVHARAIGPTDELAALCRQEADRFEPVGPAQLAAARELFRVRLTEFHPVLSAVDTRDMDWPEYLLWTDTLRLFDSPAPDDAVLEHVLKRWENGAASWPAPQLAAAADALRQYVAVLRADASHQSPHQHAAAWNTLAELLAEPTRSGQAGLDRIGAAVVARERLGEAPTLTSSIRSALGGPDMLLRASAEWLQSQASVSVDEPYRIRETYAGLFTVGSGRISGVASLQLLRDQDAARWDLLFTGASVAATTATGEVTVSSRLKTNLAARQSFHMDAGGLSVQPTLVNGATRIDYDRIDASGGARRRQAAVGAVSNGRAGAERDAAAANRRSLAAHMDADGVKTVSRFNEMYFANVRNPFTRTELSPPVAEFHSDDSAIYGAWRWPRSRTFSAPLPAFTSPTGLAFSVSAAAIEQFLGARLGGKRMTEGQIAELVGLPSDKLAAGDKSAPADEAQPDRWIEFAATPCDVELADGRVSLRLHLTAFESGGVRFPAMTADAVYTAAVENGRLKFTREGGFRTRAVAEEGSNDVAASGRQQTLRVALRRLLDRSLPAQLTWPTADANSATAPSPLDNLRIALISVTDGWLQLALTTANESNK